MFKAKDSVAIFFSICFSSFKCVVLANDPRFSLPHFIFCNAYWVCLATESIDELCVNSLKEEFRKKTFKYISKYNTIYKDPYPYHKCNWLISTSDIYINTLFLKYLMIRWFNCFLVDNNIRCTMILHIVLLFNCKYYFYYFDHVFVLSGYIQLKIMVTKCQFSLLIN